MVYVTQKLPREALLPTELVPRTVFTDDTEIRTDVVQVGVPRFVAVDTQTYRPLRGGCQIANFRGGAGTGGAVMYDRRDQSLVLLTNNHVLTDPKNPTFLPASTAISQPFGGGRIGQSKRIVPMFRAPLGATDHNWFGTVDVGIVALDSNIPVEFNVVEIGAHPYVVLPPYEGLEAVRRGFRTQLRVGTVEAVDVTVIIKNSSTGELYKVGGPDAVFMIRWWEREISADAG